MIKAIIFDFDGVLNNEHESTIYALDEISKEFNLKIDGKFIYPMLLYLDEQYGYLDYDKILEKLFSQLGINDKGRAIKLFREKCKEKLSPDFEIIQFIDRKFDNFEFYIWSREKKEDILKFLEKFSIKRYFKGIFAPVKKWDKKSFEKILLKIGKMPQECLVIGDRLIDVLIPKFVGCKVLLYNKLLGSSPNDILQALSHTFRKTRKRLQKKTKIRKA